MDSDINAERGNCYQKGKHTSHIEKKNGGIDKKAWKSAINI
jgi:hypothetical protein